MATKTAVMPTRTEAEVAVADAEAKLQDLRERIADGESIKPAELATAQAGIEMARLRLDAAERYEEQHANDGREQAIADAVAAFDGPARLARVLDAYRQTVKAITALNEAADDYREGVSECRATLRALDADDITAEFPEINRPVSWRGGPGWVRTELDDLEPLVVTASMEARYGPDVNRQTKAGRALSFVETIRTFAKQ